MNWLISGVLLVVGLYAFIFVGVFGKGFIGNTKRMAARIGIGPTRIITAIIGIALIGFGIASIINPEMFIK